MSIFQVRKTDKVCYYHLIIDFYIKGDYMLKRKIESKIEDFFSSETNKALMITGARQVGKTYIIREYAKKHFEYFIEINFIENQDAIKIFEKLLF